MLRDLGASVDVRRKPNEPPPTPPDAGYGFVETKLATLRYRLVGHGQPIVFTCDPPITLEIYDELIAEYRDKFSVLVLEVPGMGFSTARSPEAFHFQAANDTVAEAIRTLVKGQCILAFSCLAGLGAMDIAMRHSEIVDRLVLLQTPMPEDAIAWKHARDPRGILHTPVLGQLAILALKRKRAPDWLKLAIGRTQFLEPACQCADQAFEHGAGFALATVFQRYISDTLAFTGKVKQPVLSIWGEMDRSHLDTSRSYVEQYADNAAHAQVLSAGHFPELERVAVVRNIIGEFVQTGLGT